MLPMRGGALLRLRLLPLLVVAALGGFLEILDAVTEADDIARFDAVAHAVVYDMFGGEKVFSSSCLPSLPLPTTSSPSLALGVG